MKLATLLLLASGAAAVRMRLMDPEEDDDEKVVSKLSQSLKKTATVENSFEAAEFLRVEDDKKRVEESKDQETDLEKKQMADAVMKDK